MTLMKSLSLVEPGKFAFTEIPEPEVKANECLVRVLACGVCGSDLHAMSGKQPFFSYPRCLGHELCVEIVTSPTGSDFTAGDRCVIEPYFYCGECSACRKGKTNCCKNLRVLGIHFDGGHTPFLAISVDYLHKANRLTLDQAALAEPLAIGAHAVRRAQVKPGEKVAVMGMGAIGLAVAMFVKAFGAEPLLVDVDESRLSLAQNTMNLGKAFVAGGDLSSRIESYLGELPACVIDATGNSVSMHACFDLVADSGRIVFVGLFPGQVRLDMPNFHGRNLTLMASRAATSEDFKLVIDAISKGEIDPTPMISDRLSFENLDKELLELRSKSGLMKAVIEY